MQNKISRRQFLQVTGASAAALLLAGLPVEASAASGHLTVTPDTLVSDLRADPTFAASGVWTWQSAVDSPDSPKAGTTLSDYVGANMAQDSADALNYLADTYEAGTQVTYKVYSPEEIAADATRDGVELYYWPSEVPGSKFVVVMSGNVLNNTANMSEGYATAWRLHQMGYAAFVLRYRVFLKAKDNAPVADLGNAVRFITTHAGQFNVQPENYALLGYSSGGHLAGVFSGDELGYKHYGVPKPGALLLGYPINNFFEYKPVYHAAIDPFVLEGRYYELNISDCVTDDYPPVYHWYGENDYVFPLLCYPAQRPALSRALEKHHVPCKEVLFPNATHGVGTGAGTDADGWMLDAATFWETQINS